MSLANPLLVINQLIAGLPGKSREHFLHRCETVNLEFGSLLCERGQTFRHVYFPLNGFISLITVTREIKPFRGKYTWRNVWPRSQSRLPNSRLTVSQRCKKCSRLLPGKPAISWLITSSGLASDIQLSCSTNPARHWRVTGANAVTILQGAVRQMRVSVR